MHLGARRAAALLERVAAELEEDVRGAATTEDDAPELVEMRAAVALSGYTRGHLRRMLVAGTLTNYGTEARPLLRASDLPRKPGAPAAPSWRRRNDVQCRKGKPHREKEEPDGCSWVLLCNRRKHAQ